MKNITYCNCFRVYFSIFVFGDVRLNSREPVRNVNKYIL